MYAFITTFFDKTRNVKPSFYRSMMRNIHVVSATGPAPHELRFIDFLARCPRFAVEAPAMGVNMDSAAGEPSMWDEFPRDDVSYLYDVYLSLEQRGVRLEQLFRFIPPQFALAYTSSIPFAVRCLMLLRHQPVHIDTLRLMWENNVPIPYNGMIVSAGMSQIMVQGCINADGHDEHVLMARWDETIKYGDNVWRSLDSFKIETKE